MPVAAASSAMVRPLTSRWKPSSVVLCRPNVSRATESRRAFTASRRGPVCAISAQVSARWRGVKPGCSSTMSPPANALRFRFDQPEQGSVIVEGSGIPLARGNLRFEDGRRREPRRSDPGAFPVCYGSPIAPGCKPAHPIVWGPS